MVSDYEELRYYKEHNPALKLLRADSFPLIASFLKSAFKKLSRNYIPADELESELTDFLFEIQQAYPDDFPSENVRVYLDRWTNEGFLRKYYTFGSDTALYELTPSSEKALQSLGELEKKEFIGTESRLLKILDLLREIAYKGGGDPRNQLDMLQRKKKEIEKEIGKLMKGEPARLNDTQIKERFFELKETAGKLLSDFREIEYNFRDLDRTAREKQIAGQPNKGKFLQDIFNTHDFIWESDQGKSFHAFWEFLMAQEKQSELDELTHAVQNIPLIQSLQNVYFVDRLKSDLIEAGEKVNKTNHNLIEQLRKFLDDKVRIENKRVMEIIREIKQSAVRLKDFAPTQKDIMEIDDKPNVEMIMERPLYNPPRLPVIEDKTREEGATDISTEAIYKQLNINPEDLKHKISEMLVDREQIPLREVFERFPIEKGLAEVVLYIDIASKDKRAVINETVTETVLISSKAKNKQYSIIIPEIIYTK
ncbi:MAG: DUF3375 domain-containing protein [Ignavibacteria bacterium]